MRTSLRSTITVAAAVLLASSLVPRAADGQQPNPSSRAGRPATPRHSPTATAPASSGGTKIAVIDISYIYKKHFRFNQEMENMKKDVLAYEEELKRRGAMLQSKRQQLQELRPGTPDYKRIEEEIATAQAQMQADMQLTRKEFLQREGKIYYDVYQEIVREVTAVAQRYGFDLVVRFNSEAIDPEDRKSIQEGVNRAVIFHSDRLNITYHISESLNRAYQNQSARRPTGPPPRQR